MTTDKAIDTVADYLEAALTGTDTLSALDVFRNGDTETLEPPYIAVMETGAEEHEVVPNTLSVSMSVLLVTIPGASADSATTATSHRTMAAELSTLVNDYKAIADSANTEPYFLCFDVRGSAPTTTSEDGQRTTTFPLVMVCSSGG